MAFLTRQWRWCLEGRFDRPLADLPRPAALLILLAILAACIWSVPAVEHLRAADDARAAHRIAPGPGVKGDLDLYRAIDVRVARGESYYRAAVSEQLANRYPTKPFFAVRSPILAWGAGLFGLRGWRIVAIGALGLSLMALILALASRAWPVERMAAALLLVLCGIGAFQPWVGLVHELMSGLFLSLALFLYRSERWWPSLLAAAIALFIRELALPFLLLWLAFAACERRRGEVLGVLAVLALFALAVALHAHAVLAVRPPDAPASQGWTGLLGPAVFLEALIRLSPLAAFPLWLAAPLALLPLLGWLTLGGRLGLFALLWFAGFALAMALFARADNFYWAMMVLPAYAAGLAFVPRALASLLRAARSRPA